MSTSAQPETNSHPQNVDSKEIDKFSLHAHHWWDTEGPLRTLHQLNPIRLTWMQEFITFGPTLTLADIGCGGGILSESIARLGAQVHGYDLAAASLRVAQMHAMAEGIENVNYASASAEEAAQHSPERYDAVCCMEMLEHVPDPSAIVRACAQMVRPGGWVFFSTIHRNLRAFMQAIVGAEYLLHLLPKGTHEYAKLIRPSELVAYAEAAGLLVQDLRGLSYNPITQRFTLHAKTDVNYFLAARKPN